MTVASIVDLTQQRLENKKVVEHWGMFRTVPEQGGTEWF
jgi:hypothetical protein